jgi:hypothetical protein
MVLSHFRIETKCDSSKYWKACIEAQIFRFASYEISVGRAGVNELYSVCATTNIWARDLVRHKAVANVSEKRTASIISVKVVHLEYRRNTSLRIVCNHLPH